ncbi:AtpZ/AtpI family protein [Flavobacterium chuncheonense]|uniref:AtpZ/AtpI family protein n=1 Tax=Flavobacterium chuncheonense TaxID=2026653 RepID=A0ABW5YN68_9FLAO
MENPKKKKQPNGPNPWLSLISIPFQMGFVIYIFNVLGSWLNEKYQVEYYEKWITLLGVFVAIYYVIKQVSLLNRKK